MAGKNLHAHLRDGKTPQIVEQSENHRIFLAKRTTEYSPENYRPITLELQLQAVRERVILARILDGNIPKEQGRFQEKQKLVRSSF